MMFGAYTAIANWHGQTKVYEWKASGRPVL